MEYYKLIDKKDVSAFGSDFLLFIKKSIRYIITSFRKRFAVVCIIFSACLVAGYMYYHVRKPYYETDMACAYNNMHQKVYGEMIRKLDVLASSSSYAELAEVLHITKEQASAIISFKPMNAVGSALDEDFTDITNILSRYPFYIQVRAADKSVYAPLQKAILDYLNNTPYRRLRIKTETEIRNVKIFYMDRDMAQMDSLINAYTVYLKGRKGSADSVAGFSNLASLFTLKNDFEDRRIDRVYNNILTESVEVVHGFTPTDAPSKLTYKYWLLVLIGGFLLACIAAVIVNVLYE